MTAAVAAAVTEQGGGHVVLCGLDRLGLRTLQELRLLGEEVAVVTRDATDSFVNSARTLGATVVPGSYRDEAILRAAGIGQARALILAEDDDVGNLHAALAAQELNPGLRIVLRMFNEEFGVRVQSLFRDCTALSPAAIGAPAFVAAALHDDWDQRIDIAGRTLLVRECSPQDPRVVVPLARTLADGTVALFPDEGDRLLCLAYADQTAEAKWTAAPRPAAHLAHRPRSPRALLAAVWSAFDARVRLLWATLLALIAISTVIFYLSSDLDAVDALYFAVTVITTTGFGDISFREGPVALELYVISLMIIGTALLAIFYALVTDAIVGARLSRALGAPLGTLRDHFVVCGVGNIGYRVVEQLVSLGLDVVAAESVETSRFLPAIRRLGVPVVVADARLVETLRALNVAQAACVIVATNDDVANLETAFNARILGPRVRLVLRLFDPDLAARMERAFGINISRSVSALAAPAFAAAAVGERVLTTIPIGQQVLIVAQARVEPGSRQEGQPLSDLEASTESRALALLDGARQTWSPARTTPLLAGQQIIAVTTARGLGQLLSRTEARAQKASAQEPEPGSAE